MNVTALRHRSVPLLLLALAVLSILWKGGKSLESTWVMGGVAVLATFHHWAFERRREDHREIPFPVWFLLIGFLASTLASFLLSATANYGLDEVLRDTALVLLLFWAVRKPSADAQQFWNAFIAAIAIAALVACAAGAVIYVAQPVTRFVGTFVDWRFHTDYWPNAWAQFLLIAWPCVALWSLRKGVATATVSLGVIIGCLLLSFSRGAILAFGAQVFLTGALLLWMRRRTAIATLRPVIPAILGSAVIAVLIFVSLNAARSQFFPVESVARKATFTAAEGSSSISERREFWDASFALSLERPIFGWGPYSFRFVHPRLQQSVFATSDHAHNVFLKLMMERGWIAAGLFAAALLSILLRGLRRTGAADISVPALLRPAAIVSCTGVLLHNLIDYNLQFVGIALPLWLLLAAIEPGGRAKAHYVSLMRVTELGVGILVGIVLILEGRFLVLSSLGRHAEAAGRNAEALSWYAQAQEEIFSRDMHLSRAGLSLQEGDLSSADAALDDYARVNAEDARLWILRGDMAERSGSLEEATDFYMRALTLGRLNYLNPLEGLLRIALATNRADLAVVYEDIAVKFADAISVNSHFIALSDAPETLERIAVLLRRLSPVAWERVRGPFERALDNAEKEREAYDARPAGMLW